MDGFEIALIFGLIVLLIAVMYLAHRVQKMHRHTRYLRHLVKRLEGMEENNEHLGKQDASGG